MRVVGRARGGGEVLWMGAERTEGSDRSAPIQTTTPVVHDGTRDAPSALRQFSVPPCHGFLALRDIVGQEEPSTRSEASIATPHLCAPAVHPAPSAHTRFREAGTSRIQAGVGRNDTPRPDVRRDQRPDVGIVVVAKPFDREATATE